MRSSSSTALNLLNRATTPSTELYSLLGAALDGRDERDRRRFERFSTLPERDDMVHVLESFLSAAQRSGALDWSDLGRTWGVNTFPSDGRRAIRVNVGGREALDIQLDGTVGWYLTGMEDPPTPAGGRSAALLQGIGDDPPNIRCEATLPDAAALIALPIVASRFGEWFSSCLGRNLQRSWHNVAFEEWLRTRTLPNVGG